jgi:hypothetical protein
VEQSWGCSNVTLNTRAADLAPRVEIEQINIILTSYICQYYFTFNKPTHNMLLLLIQEIKRDIIYRWMNLPPSAQQVTVPQGLAAHLDSII